MKKFISGFILLLATALIGQWLFIKYVPNLIYKIAVHRSATESNTWIHAPKTNANLRRVVLPNPDFVYSALFYDVRENEITISGTLPDSAYASVSFYDNRCQAFYVFNNKDKGKPGKFEFTLSPHKTSMENTVRAKTGRGVVLCRFLIMNDSSYNGLVSLQKELKVHALK